MTQFDTTKVQSSSLTPGLQDLGAVPDSNISFSGTIPIHGVLTTTVNLNFPTNKVISLVRVNITGVGSGIWFPIVGSTGISTSTSATGTYYMYFTVQSSSTGRQVNIQFYNETVGSTVTITNLPITIHAHLYSYAW